MGENKMKTRWRGVYYHKDRDQKLKDPTMIYVKEPETAALGMITVNPHAVIERNCFDNPDIISVRVYYE